MEITLNKKNLNEIIVSTFAKNKLGFRFIKYHRGVYVFKSKRINAKASDLAKLKVKLRKQTIICSMQSIADSSLMNNIYVSSGLLNRQSHLENTSNDVESSSDRNTYKFGNSASSLEKTMEQICCDFNNQGKRFFEENDKRFYDERYKTAERFINSLQADKDALRIQFDEDSEKANYSLLQNTNKILCELVFALQKVASGKHEMENHLIAYEFMHKYMFE